eukprot:GFUD01037003.1.p1 GENE.GFUD01037003.1~~GFUD01037003.1.p1  ORF type:complete len:302 (+),score=62.53 GFUD01037003.1:108-1013(+)
MLKAKNNLLPHTEFSAENQAKWNRDFFFIQAADTQLGLMYNFGSDGSDGTPYPDSKWETEIELCKASVEILNGMNPKPEFFIVCGDLVDAFGDKFPEIRQRQEKDLKEIYSKLSPEIPMICVCGNHDIGNSPTHETINTYKASFGDDYFSFYKNGCCFIVLNSQFYEDASNVPDLYKQHETWLESELKTATERGVEHIVVFQHIPWFVEKSDEEKIYFNVEKELRMKKLEQFHKAGVRKIFCGHYHRNAGGFYKDLEVVVTSAIGCQIGPDQHGMRVVKVRKSGLEHDYHPLDNFPTRITL